MSSPVLVTGFEPFGGANLNPSQLVVERLAAGAVSVPIRTAVLPVEYSASARSLLALIEEHQPRAVVCLGQAEGRSELSFERVAVNLNDSRAADNSGVVRIDLPINATGVAAWFTTLPLQQMVDAARAVGVPAGLSLSAGTFVCNHIFYVMQSELAGKGVASGFVHLPLVPEQSEQFPGQPTLDLDSQVRGIAAAIESL